MSKIDNLIINDIKMLSLDMIKESGSGNSGLALNSAPLFYSLFMNHLKYNINNENWLNKDRIFVSNKLLPSYYASKNMFGYDVPLDNLKEYNKFDSNLPGYQSFSNVCGDLIGYGIGTCLGERYLSSLVRQEDNKSKLVDFNTYCICTLNDIISGTAFESLVYAVREKLNKLIIIAIKDKCGNYSDREDFYSNDLINYLEEINLNVIEAKSNSIGSIDDAIDDAKNSSMPSIILIDSYYDKDFKDNDYDRPLTKDELESLRIKFKINAAFDVEEEHYQIVSKSINKRLNKELDKWNEIKEDSLNNEKLKNIIEFLETKDIKLDFNIDNLKINDNYEEELLLGNSKIFNIFAKKSPYILSLSNNNFNNNYCNIKSSKCMTKVTPTEKNINFGPSSLLMTCAAIGLAKLGFKIFVSSPLINSNQIYPFIKNSALEELDIHFIFTHDTFLNTYDNLGISATQEINSFRLIPKLITFRPADINEIIGVYNILANYKRCSITIIGSGSIPKLIGTNPKYVVAGAYRVKKEREEANGVIIATGTEVNLALKIAEELLPYGIDMRVVTMPCLELFANQSEKYQNILLPKELKTFVIEFGSTLLWYKYATGEEYILGLDRYSTNGTKEELLNKYNLNIDAIKTRIIELMKK